MSREAHGGRCETRAERRKVRGARRDLRGKALDVFERDARNGRLEDKITVVWNAGRLREVYTTLEEDNEGRIEKELNEHSNLCPKENVDNPTIYILRSNSEAT